MDKQTMYLLEEPIHTIFGELKYLKFIEYMKLSSHLTYISMKPLHLHYEYKKQLKDVPIENRKDFMEYVNVLKEISLFELIHNDENLKEHYSIVFNNVIDFKDGFSKDDIFNNEEYLMKIRELILDMNYITEEPVSPNPEIQKYYEDRKKQKSKENGNITIADIITSIVVGTSNSFEDVKNMTPIQIYSIFYRIGAFKNFDTSTLFATVSSDVKVTSWSENVNLFKKEELGISYNEFNAQYKGIFN